MKTEIITEKQDLTYLNWSRTRGSSGTAGSFLKAYSDLGGVKTYYKLSNYDVVHGIVGHESVNELIVDRLLTRLGIEHLHYKLIHADIIVDGRKTETWLCASEDFKQKGESKIALDQFYAAEREPDETPLNFCLRMGWGNYIRNMLLVDYIILNRDRHGANIEILRNSRTRTYRPAPLFDHGLSLLCRCGDAESVRAFDVMEDRPIQCFVGSRSAWDNLKLIPREELPVIAPPDPDFKKELVSGLDAALPRLWLDKIWEMIYRRWCAYEDFCDKE